LDNHELLKVLVMAEDFCKQNSCGLTHDAICRAIDIVTAEIRTSAKTSKTVANKKHRLDECPDCEGFGWNEGGKFLQTTCKTCKGTGIINKHLKEVEYASKCRKKH
jgi:hypothetical protein